MTGIWASEPLAAPSTDPIPEPVRCEVGIYGHRWILTIEESQQTLSLAPGEVCPMALSNWSPSTPRPVCELTLEGFEAADFSMGTEMSVRLTDGTDCPGSGAAEMGSHYVDHNPGGICDCDHWLEIVPVERYADPRFTGSPETIVRALAAQLSTFDPEYDAQVCCGRQCGSDEDLHEDGCYYAAARAWVAAHPPPPPAVVDRVEEGSMTVFTTERQRKLGKSGETMDVLQPMMEWGLANHMRVDPPALEELFKRPGGASEAEVRERAIRFEDWWFFDFRPWRTLYDPETMDPLSRVGLVLGWPNGQEPQRGRTIRLYAEDPVEGEACREAVHEWLRSEGAQEVPAWVLEDYDSKPWNQR